MATAKIQTVKGLRVEIFSRPVRKNTTRPLTVWIVGTEIEQGLFSTGRCAILEPNEQMKGKGLYAQKFFTHRSDFADTVGRCGSHHRGRGGSVGFWG